MIYPSFHLSIYSIGLCVTHVKKLEFVDETRHSLLVVLGSGQKCITCIELCISVQFSFLVNNAPARFLQNFRWSGPGYHTPHTFVLFIKVFSYLFPRVAEMVCSWNKIESRFGGNCFYTQMCSSGLLDHVEV